MANPKPVGGPKVEEQVVKVTEDRADWCDDERDTRHTLPIKRRGHHEDLVLHDLGKICKGIVNECRPTTSLATIEYIDYDFEPEGGMQEDPALMMVMEGYVERQFQAEAPMSSSVHADAIDELGGPQADVPSKLARNMYI